MNQSRNIGGQGSWLLARVQYDRIRFPPEKSQFLLQQDVEWYETRLRLSEGTNTLKAHAPIIEVASDKLQNALQASSRVSNDNETIPTLRFGENDMVCLDGQACIKAARPTLCGPGGDGFGFVRIVHNIKPNERNEILHGFRHQISPDVGRVYKAIRSGDLDVEQQNRLRSMLEPGQQKGLIKLENCVRFRYAYDKVTNALPTIAHGFCWGKVPEYHATRCEISFERYLVGYIFAFWQKVTRQSQSPLNSARRFSMNDIPAEVFARLHGLMPGISKKDRAKVHGVFSDSEVFGSLSAHHRDALMKSILGTYCMIPSMALFARHMLVLEKISFCIGDLLGLRGKHVKRGQGCEKPLETMLKELYVGRSGDDEYQIQTIRGWRTTKTQVSFKDRQDLSCRQLWLFVMRHDKPQLVDRNHLAYMAKKLGFYSNSIATRAAEYKSTGRTTHNSTSWATLPEVSIEERLGQKGGRWLGKSESARNVLFFDVAETIGTEAGQKIHKLKKFTPLVELACIYRAFFGDYSSPSPYADIIHKKVPHAIGNASPKSLAEVNTSNEISPPSQTSLDIQLRRATSYLEGHSCPWVSDGTDCSPGSLTPNSQDASVLAAESGFSPGRSASSQQGPSDPESHDDCSVRSSTSTYYSVESEAVPVLLSGTFPSIEYPHIESESESEQAQLFIHSTLSDRVETHEDRSLERLQSMDSNNLGLKTRDRCPVESCSLQPLSDGGAGINYPSLPNLSPSSPKSRSRQSTSLRDTVDCHEDHPSAPHHLVTEPTAQDDSMMRNTCSAPDYDCPADGPIEPTIIYPPLPVGSISTPPKSPTQEKIGNKASHSDSEFSAGITTSNDLIVTAPKTHYDVPVGSSIYLPSYDSAVVVYPSLCEPTTSMQTTRPDRASDDNRTSDWHGGPSAGIATSNENITRESEMQSNFSAEKPRSEVDYGSHDNSVVMYPYLSNPSIGYPSSGPDTVKSRIDGPNWPGLARLHQSPKILPNAERSCPSPTRSSPRKISVMSLLNPVTTQTQKDVASRGTRCRSKDENHDNVLTQIRPAVVNEPPTLAPTVDEIHEKFGNSATTEEIPDSERSELENCKAPAAKEHVASIPVQANRRRSQEVQPKSGKAAHTMAALKECRQTKKEGLQPQTDEPDHLVMEDSCDGYQDSLPMSPYPGDDSDKQYRGSMELFEDYNDHDAHQEDHGLKAADITNLNREAQGSAIVSAWSRTGTNTEPANHTKNNPFSIYYGDHSQEDRHPGPEIPDETNVREQRTTKGGRLDHDPSLKEDRLSSQPRTPRALHGLPKGTSAGQEQPDGAILPESLPPKVSPTSDQSSAETHSEDSRGLEQMPDPGRLLQEVDETSKVPTQECSVPEFPKPQYLHAPSMHPNSQERGSHTRDEPLSPPQGPSQPGLCSGNGTFTGHSNWQQPSVQDVDDPQQEQVWSTAGGLTRPPGSHYSGRDTRLPVEPAVISSISSTPGATQQVKAQELSTSAGQKQPDEVIQPESLPPKTSPTSNRSSAESHPGGSHGLKQRSDPESLLQVEDKMSKAPTQQCSVPKIHAPSTPRVSREDERLQPTWSLKASSTNKQSSAGGHTESSHGLEQRPDPGSLLQEESEISKASTQRCSDPNIHAPSTPPVPQGRGHHTQDEPLSPPQAPSQPGLYNGNGTCTGRSNWQQPSVQDVDDPQQEQVWSTGGSHGLEPRPDPGSLSQETDEISKSPVQGYSAPDFPEPQCPHVPPMAPVTQKRRHHVSDKPLSPRQAQQGLCNGNDTFTVRSNWQQPFVQDVSDSEEEQVWSTAEGPTRPPGSHYFAIETRLPAEPAEPAVPLAPSTPGSTERAQTQGLQEDDGQSPVEKRTCPNGDSVATERGQHPTSATEEPDAKKDNISPNTLASKRRNSDTYTSTNKRPCMPSPKQDRLDQTAAWAISRHRLLLQRQQPDFSEIDRSRLYGLPSGIFSEESSVSSGETLVPPTTDNPTCDTTVFDTVPEPHAAHARTFTSVPPPPPHDTRDGGGIFASETQFNRFQMPYEGLGAVGAEQHADNTPRDKPYSIPDDSPQAPNDKMSTPVMPFYETNTVPTSLETAQPEPSENFNSATAASESRLDTENRHSHPLSPNFAGFQPFTSTSQTTHDPRSMSSDRLSQKDPDSVTASQATTDLDTSAGQFARGSTPDQQSRVEAGAETEASPSSVREPVPAPPMAPCRMAAANAQPGTPPLVHSSSVNPPASASIMPEIKLSAILNPEPAPSGPTEANDSKDYAEERHCGPPNRNANPLDKPAVKTRKRRCSTPESLHDPRGSNSSSTTTQNVPESHRPDKEYPRGQENLSHQVGQVGQVDNQVTSHDRDVDMVVAHTVQSLVGSISSGPAFDDTPNKRVCYGIDYTSNTQAGTACADIAGKSREEYSSSGNSLASQPTDARLHGVHYEGQSMQITHEGPTPRLSLTPNLQPPEQIRPQSDERASVKLSKVKRARRIHDWGQPLDDLVFIVEIDGENLECVHHRPKEGRIAPLLRQIQQHSRSGKFFNKNLRIVELNPNKNGMIPIDRFFQTEEVLVFQRRSHDGADSTRLVEKIKQAVLDEKKAASQKAVKHRYYLRSMKRQRGVDLKHSERVLPKSAKQNHYLRLRDRRKDVNLRGPGAASRGSANHDHYLRSMKRRKGVEIRCSEDKPMFFAH
ncbi:hypothetical protein N7448_011373 [Penicillium atrosanguineum]|nr:hypothetical protein N7448_011373 [Penicillium atrosanguineum]